MRLNSEQTKFQSRKILGDPFVLISFPKAPTCSGARRLAWDGNKPATSPSPAPKTKGQSLPPWFRFRPLGSYSCFRYVLPCRGDLCLECSGLISGVLLWFCAQVAGGGDRPIRVPGWTCKRRGSTPRASGCLRGRRPPPRWGGPSPSSSAPATAAAAFLLALRLLEARPAAAAGGRRTRCAVLGIGTRGTAAAW